MISKYKAEVFRSAVNPFIGMLFVASFALGAGLIIWQVAFNENPVTNAFEKAIIRNTQLPQDTPAGN